MKTARAYESGKTVVVGQFFEKLGSAIFGGEPHYDGTCDIACWNLACGIEIKASDSNHSWRCAIDQLDHYCKLAQGFPFSNFLYALFSYKNKRVSSGKNRTRTALSRCRGKELQQSFLLRNVEALWILDINVLFTLRKQLGLSEGAIPCHPEKITLNIARTVLQQFCRDASGNLQTAFGTIAASKERTLFSDEQIISIPTTFVVSPDLCCDLIRHLQKREVLSSVTT